MVADVECPARLAAHTAVVMHTSMHLLFSAPGSSRAGAMHVAASRTEPVTRAEAAYAALKGEILANQLPPGFQAFEVELAERLGMSRTPVREALLRLSLIHI